MAAAIEILCPAKINLHLRVVGRRPDGYHELETVFQRVSLFDRLRVGRSNTPSVALSCPDSVLPEDERNLVWRAADLFLRTTGSEAGVELTLRKSIPLAAGLGGGSSDAASALLGLNHLFGRPLSNERLEEMGLSLGADVSFFLREVSAAVGEGVGERLTPVTLPRKWFVLVHPPLEVPTAWVYRNLKMELTITTRSPIKNGPGIATWAVENLHNDLESVTLAAYPELRAIRETLVSLGAEQALMSGSGPTVFGMFSRREPAEASYREAVARHGWKASLVRGF